MACSGSFPGSIAIFATSIRINLRVRSQLGVLQLPGSLARGHLGWGLVTSARLGLSKLGLGLGTGKSGAQGPLDPIVFPLCLSSRPSARVGTLRF